jgi:hypothetical protein
MITCEQYDEYNRQLNRSLIYGGMTLHTIVSKQVCIDDDGKITPIAEAVNEHLGGCRIHMDENKKWSK